jgi:S-adenosyl-L-methionine hydrolase (adenosine-forming)
VTATVFLATDYGYDDEFAGVLHAVIARLAPDARVIDLSHGIEPFDVAGGAALLARAVPALGDGVVCAVVDPGVGSSRRAIALEVARPPRLLVGPDNGLLGWAAAALGGVRRAVELASDRAAHGASSTFDGRDVFAPAAARLARGDALDDLGTPVDASSLVALLESPRVAARTLEDGRVVLTGTVRWIDRFGNVQLSVPGRVLAGASAAGIDVRGDDTLVRVVRSYAELEEGAAGLLCDANDAVALVVGRGSAREHFGVAIGDRIDLVGDFGPLR